MPPDHPSILRRYLSTAIDGLFAVFIYIGITVFLQQETETGMYLRVGSAATIFFIYEPFCTSKLCTIGQKLMGIRVRNYSTQDRLSLPAAYARFIVKLTLGFISFFSIAFSKDRRAIHDFASGSIMIDATSAKA